MNNAAALPSARPNRVLWIVIGVLLVLNALLVGCLLMGPRQEACSHPAGHGHGTRATAGASFLADTLQLTAAQRVGYDSLRARYVQQVQPLAMSCRASCQQFFAQLDPGLSDAQLAEKSRAALSNKVAVDVATVRHLQQVAVLCTPPQRQLLHRLLTQQPGHGCAAPGSEGVECFSPLHQRSQENKK
ncbi:MAG TPA: Spy/CpxP family protein refolding chaperone [Hymenobacter sp.]|jgi:hypothetical protein